MSLSLSAVGALGWALVATVAPFGAHPGYQAPTAQGGPEETAVFELATEILPSSGIQLTNGVVVFASDWPTLVFAKFSANATTGQHSASCSGTLVGPRVLLTAAHCLDNGFGPQKQARLRVDGRDLHLVCERHPAYLALDVTIRIPRGSSDFALCRIEDQGDTPASLGSMMYEVVEPDRPPRVGEPVLLTGYGCSNLRFEGDSLVWTAEPQVLRIGDERIDTSTGSTASPDYVTVLSRGLQEPALCPGDSGGPMFSGVTASNPTGARRLRGVNSMVDRAPGSSLTRDVVSSVASTGGPTFRVWARDWLRRTRQHGTTICGLNAPAGQGRCRR